MNLQKLKGKIVEFNLTYEDMAKCTNMSKTTFSDKINGKRKFYIGEVNDISNKLLLTEDEKKEIFLY